MKRYFDSKTKTEALPGIHFDLSNKPDSILVIESDHPFFDPANKKRKFDSSAKMLPDDTDYKALKWGEVKQLRNSKRIADIEYKGGVFQMDDLSRENLKDQQEEGVSVEWRLSNNEVLEVSPEDVADILSIYRQRKQNLYVKSWVVEETINASGDAKSIDVETLYNEALAEK